MQNLDFTGTQINYYFVCRRKLWLFSKDIRFESENEYVQLGRLIDEHSYKRKKKQLEIGRIKIDFMDGKGVIHEVKKSNKVEKAHIYQLKYYLLTLVKMGAAHVTGEIDYPKLKKRKTVLLEPGDEEEFERVFSDIREILDRPHPPAAVRKTICGKCAYYEFCFA
ncbi:CRISPR-associated exonuclease Cas4 [Candidatus Desulfarcum epimagneticum]|uniref:CRISPR-associated exonuclease Cas4 n=1 Tax=uncultured Desulfobacteraceae bacterium TaxID=218296 RepID=A0A484HH86_9BACT|nr:CRISPR-associated exonuclease Cas4 [uncultured Desulfobacteraceae bacterium]